MGTQNLTPHYLTDQTLAQFVDSALNEDWGTGPKAGDHSSLAIVPAETLGRAKCILKSEGVLAGLDLAEMIFALKAPEAKFNKLMNDGQRFVKGDIAFTVEAPVVKLLGLERLVLNCMQRMSGIATYTAYLSAMISHTKCKLLDTRKTTPNFRMAEKWAVVIGGGTNHRFGLYDMVMLKDNHVDFAGGITNAVNKTRQYLKDKQLSLPIEVETRNLDEVREALAMQVDRIMLDNMPLDMMRQAVTMINGACEVEASGGITEQTIAAVAETGVDYISVGALTHQVKSLDISLKAY